MCGIGGIYGFGNKEERHAWATSINSTQHHRGPDNQTVKSFEEISLGHVRLSIIDVSDVSHQPMSTEDGRYTLTYNGEIYNYQEIKAQLNEYSFKTNSDTEVILAAYQKWGKSCVQKFNGMFAFAIWDEDKKELFVARDRMGIKPLYYYFDDKGLVFSSELSALLQLPFIPKKLNRKALAHYFRYFTVNAPDTLVENVKILPSGSSLTLTIDEIKIEKYWDERLNYSGKAYNLSEQEIYGEIKTLFQSAVKNRLVADVPFGAFLSGGIDSSLVVATMSEYSSKVNTFNISFEEKEFSEAKYAQIIADKYATNHTEIKLSPDDFLNIIPDALKAQDVPSLDGFNTYLVSKVTKEAGVTMALSGLGGDELFGGYDVFKQLYKLKNNLWISSFPSVVRILPAYLYKTLKPSTAANKLYDIFRQDYLDLEYVYPVFRQVYLENEVQAFLNYSPSKNATIDFLAKHIAFGTEGYNMPYLSKISYAEFNTYLQNVLLRDTDVMSMAHALEVRVPFLDHKLVEFVLGVPDEIKNPITPKQLLVNAFKDVLPDEIINRPKMGFVFPWEQWLKSNLKPSLEDSLENLKKRNFIEPKTVESVKQDFYKGKVNWSRVWGLVVLENWLAKNNIED